jgi:nicotinamidase-related amidase
MLRLLVAFCLVSLLDASTVLRAAENSFALHARSRVETAKGSGRFHAVTRNETWRADQTAVIVCDMWDAHHCLNAVRRVKEMAPRMNEFLVEARDRGALVIHAPSSCTNFYKDHPGRKRAQAAPRAANLPADIGQWCNRIPAEERGEYPIDQSDGGEDDDPAEHAAWAAELTKQGRNPRSPWARQIDVLEIHEQDAISDSGVEIWNLLESRGIKNVILLGVHTNMCVLGRPFGLRQMAKNGKRVVLVRDLTDTMYNPQMRPYDCRAHRKISLPFDAQQRPIGRRGVPIQERSPQTPGDGAGRRRVSYGGYPARLRGKTLGPRLSRHEGFRRRP